MTIGQSNIPALKKAEDAIMAKVPPAKKQMVERVVEAGMTIMYAPNFKKLMQERIRGTPNPVKDAGEGAARLAGEVARQTGGIDPSVAIPAMVMFVCEYFDIYAQLSGKEVTPDMVGAAVAKAMDAMLKAAGVTEEQIQQYMAKNKGALPPGADGGAPAAAPAAPAGHGIVNAEQAPV